MMRLHLPDPLTPLPTRSVNGSYFLNIAKEAEVSTDPVATTSASGDVKVYKYMIFTWSAAGGEQTKYVAYQVITGTDNTVHEVLLSDSEAGGYTKIIEATMDNAAERLWP